MAFISSAQHLPVVQCKAVLTISVRVFDSSTRRRTSLGVLQRSCALLWQSFIRVYLRHGLLPSRSLGLPPAESVFYWYAFFRKEGWRAIIAPLKHRVVHAVLIQYIHTGGAVYLRVVASHTAPHQGRAKAGDAPILYVLRRKERLARPTVWLQLPSEC